jgi:hypothetical protein
MKLCSSLDRPARDSWESVLYYRRGAEEARGAHNPEVVRVGVWEIIVAWKRTEAERLRCRDLFTFAMNPFPHPQAQAPAALHAYFRTLYPTFDATLARCGGFVDLTLDFLGGKRSSSEVDEELAIRRPPPPPPHYHHHHQPAHIGGDATPPPPPPSAADVVHEKDVFAILGFTNSPLYRYAFCFVLF